MRRLFAAILILALVFSTCSCAKNDIRTPVSFYYCTNPVDYNTPSGVISAETREADGIGSDLISLLNVYLQGPESEEFLSPFPGNVKVESISADSPVAKLSLTKAFASLTGHNLTIACVCISLTVIELTGCERVQISVADAQLEGNDYIEMSADDFLFLDDYTSETTP